MIKILCETMTNSYDSSLKIKIMEYDSLDSFKREVLKHYPKIHISLPKDDEEYWFGIQYGDTSDGFWFRWLMAIVDTTRGCLYSRGGNDCANYFGLPRKTQYCSKAVYTMLEEIKKEVEYRKQNIIFVE